MNCAKGGVFLQLCGWMGTWELWVGSISDTNYANRAGFLGVQEQFVSSSVSSKIPFFNILDRGYRLALSAWQLGRQFVMQPCFKDGAFKFNTDQVMYSASVAADRSGNERAVNRVKFSQRICHGLKANADPNYLADLWLVWGFQCNFMFESVL